MNGEQCRSARAMMGWSIKQLSRQIRVNESTISDFENRDRVRLETKSRIRSLFVTNGIEFIEDDNGIGLKRRLKLDEYLSRNEERSSRHRFTELEALSIDATG